MQLPYQTSTLNKIMTEFQYLSGCKLHGIVIKDLETFHAGGHDLLQLSEGVRLEGHPGQALYKTVTQVSRHHTLAQAAQHSLNLSTVLFSTKH